MMDINGQVGKAEGTSAGGQQSLMRLQAHQRAWEVFGADALTMIPILQAQMSAVTLETEQAALKLMMQVRILAASSSGGAAHDRTESVSHIVMAMQFQDITRQKLEHVGKALSHLQTHLQVLMKGPQSGDTSEELAALARFDHQYTMEAERRLHQSTLSPEYGEPVPTSLSGEADNSVELF